MKIKMLIEEVEINENYKPHKDSIYGNYDARTDDERWPERVSRRLEVELTEDEWKAVKRAVLEAMK